MTDQIQKDVNNFKNHMLVKLEENSDKGYWSDSSLLSLAKRIAEKNDKLIDAILRGNPEGVIRESVNIGNFAMMVYTNQAVSCVSKLSAYLCVDHTLCDIDCAGSDCPHYGEAGVFEGKGEDECEQNYNRGQKS